MTEKDLCSWTRFPRVSWSELDQTCVKIFVMKPSGRVLALSAGGPGYNPQSYQRRYKNGTSKSLV